MRIAEPKVYMIAETKLDMEELEAALQEHGGRIATNWLAKTAPAAKSDGEYLTEVAGRICYNSYGLGLNPNITKIRESSQGYLDNTLAKGDGSIFEHASCSFAFINVSRVLTHELVRHRVGVAISQESGRYVRPRPGEGIRFFVPSGLREEDKMKITHIVEDVEKGYDELVAGQDWDHMDFALKKGLTSTLRRVLPNGMANSVVWTANHRTIRHVINMRTAEAAEEEIRYVFGKVAEIVRVKYPLIYNDFEPNPLPDGTKSWKPKYVKA